MTKKRNARRPKPLDPTDPVEVFTEDLRGILRHSRRDMGLTWKAIAGETRLCNATVSRFGNGDTKNPQLRTVFLIMGVVGVTLTRTIMSTPLTVVKGGKK